MKIQNEKKYLDALKKQREKSELGIIENLRVASSDNRSFELIEKKFPWGERKIFLIKDNQEENYTALQQARSLAGGSSEKNIEKAKEKVISEIHNLEPQDWVRFNELSTAFRVLFHDAKYQPKSMCELGYRVPRVLDYYRKKGWEVSGYDVVEMNNFLARELGYDVKFYDFNSFDGELDLGGIDLVVSYHMLEHVSDPLPAVQKIFDSMKDDSYLHVEIPIEPGLPRVEFAHMFPFEPGDMLKMLQEAGFTVLLGSNKTHTGGPHIERYTAYKGSNE